MRTLWILGVVILHLVLPAIILAASGQERSSVIGVELVIIDQ